MFDAGLVRLIVYNQYRNGCECPGARGWRQPEAELPKDELILLHDTYHGAASVLLKEGLRVHRLSAEVPVGL